MAKSNSKPGASNPIKGTLQTVPGEPSRLKIYKIESSQFWQARVYVNGRYRISSLGTADLKKAYRAAKEFFVKAIVESESSGDAKNSKIKSKNFVVVGKAFIESQNIVGRERRYNDDRIRFNKELVPFFSEAQVDQISSADIGALAKKLTESGKSSATVTQYLVVLRKILKYGADNRLLQTIPSFPKVGGRYAGMTKRDYFPLEEYQLLVKTIEEMAKQEVKVRGVLVTLEFKYLVQFMVNSFIRPSDLRVIKRQHVEVLTNEKAKKASDKKYLLLKHPPTKTTDTEVVTMPAAYGVYKSLVDLQDKSKKRKDSDYLFFPGYANRTTMITVAGRIFQAVVKEAGLDREGEKHTLYSLRHTSIMYRLLKSNANTLELARNARTSQAMIEKFYASRLTPMMAVESIHSFKK